MNKSQIIGQTVEYVKQTQTEYDSAHDWWHIWRVSQLAKRIGKEEKADLFIVELAALLHDIADYKFHGGDETLNEKRAKAWLEKMKLPNETIKHIVEIINDLSYKGSEVATPMKTIEGQVVQDADRLDAIGAIGITRTFNYGGSKGRQIYDPKIKPIYHQAFADYKRGSPPTINHFYEKLLLLKDRMNTKTAKKLAKGRHKVMEDFLSEFYSEWEGRK